MKIAVIGMGYVGIANALLAAQKHTVKVVDISDNRVNRLNNKESPIVDPMVSEALCSNLYDIEATTNLDDACQSSGLVIISVPTDFDESTSRFDTSILDLVISQVFNINQEIIIVIKSTIPIGYVERLCKEYKSDKIIFSPEFLREGKAFYDALYPSRIVIGNKGKIGEYVSAFFADLVKTKNVPVMLTSPREAEAIKLLSNTYLALRIAFFNEVDTFAELKKLDARDIITGMGLDERVGLHYNNPSFGYGGYCLPKDTKQIISEFLDVPNCVISAIDKSNTVRKHHIARIIAEKNPRKVGIYRLSMKKDSDNCRESSAQDLALLLYEKGLSVIIYDPFIKIDEDKYTYVNDFNEFVQMCDIIVANRMDDRLIRYKGKVYTRDLFHVN